MALTREEVMRRMLDHMVKGLKGYVKKELNRFGIYSLVNDDPHLLLKLMIENWQGVFGRSLGEREKNYVHELRTFRNLVSHGEKLTTLDIERALLGLYGLLSSVGANTEAESVEGLRTKLVQQRLEDSARKRAKTAAEQATRSEDLPGNLKAWRLVASPHEDVQSGRYQEADYAANLWEVFSGRAGSEYGNAADFFRRTYLTDGLRRLLLDALMRLSGKGGTPVYELMTNFGGGKTHSLLALFHMFGGTDAKALAGVGELLSEADVKELPQVRRAVIVGTQTVQPTQEGIKPDGTVIRTLWGEIAWQLGGKDGYELVRTADESGTNPGDALRELFSRYSPCLILIDEWIAYARQLADDPGQPGGSFETQMTFAQTLTEAAQAAPEALVVISLPESSKEIGGERGEKAHGIIKNLLHRIRTPWRPAERQESFEIVRRRMFKEIPESEARAVVRSFRDVYAKSPSEFPSAALDPSYEERMLKCYPFHPEFFDRLYEDWATLDDFQHTRGVLKLAAGVVNALWSSDDKNLLIMPGHLPLANSRVQNQLTSFLSTNWHSVISSDVDGPDALPARLDSEFNNLGRYSAGRRVARCVFLGSAPSSRNTARGIDDRQVMLGCVQPGEQVAAFSDALRRLVERASHLYNEGQRYWFDTKVTLNKVAQQYADEIDAQQIREALNGELKSWKNEAQPFRAIHLAPSGSVDVADGRELRLVVLPPWEAHSHKDSSSPAMARTRELVHFFGERDRVYRNCLVFLAADLRIAEGLEAIARKMLAWKRVLDEKGEDQLNLDQAQAANAEKRLKDARKELSDKLREAYVWALNPHSTSSSQLEFEIESFKLTNAAGTVGQRVAERLKSVDDLLEKMVPSALRKRIEQPLTDSPDSNLWRGNHVKVADLEEDFAKYLYLPKIRDSLVIHNALRESDQSLMWASEGFAFAQSYDELTGFYSGISKSLGLGGTVSDKLIVRPQVAEPLLEEAEREKIKEQAAAAQTGSQTAAAPRVYRRFYASMKLDNDRLEDNIRSIRRDVLQKLAEVPGSDLEVSIEIVARLPEGIDEHSKMVVSENSKTLGMTPQFESS